MPLLIDTFNVLHTTGVLPTEQAGIDVDDLIGLLAVSRYRRQPIALICDGPGRDYDDPESCGGVQVRYSGPGRPADDVIIDLIRRESAPRRLLVVSSDQEIVRAARRRRCRSMKSDTLLHHLAADLERAAHPKPGPSRPTIIAPLPRSEVQKWIEAFELHDPEQELAAAAPPPPEAPPSETAPPEKTLPSEDESSDRSPATMDDQSVPSPSVEPMDARAALPDELIAEAEQLVDREPELDESTPTVQGDADDPARSERALDIHDEDGRNAGRDADNAEPHDPMADVAAQYKDADVGRRTARRLSRKQLAELSEDDLDAIDMQHLVSDVAPIEEKDEQQS